MPASKSTSLTADGGNVADRFAARLPRVIAAWSLLLAADVVGKLFGFESLHRAVARVQTLRWRPREPEMRTRRLCDAVEAASVYYFHRVNCLQSAAAAVCLLRLCGVAADLVIGVQRMPFEAHAWVESGGQVVMNNRSRLMLYHAIARF